MGLEERLQVPYVGPRPFERHHKDLFFGRGAEANELLSLIIAHRAVLVHAPSGAGKTSLLNAGLIPLLEGEEFQILPPARVRGLVPDGIAPSAIANIYAFNALLGWAEGEVDPAALAQTTLASFLAQREHPVDDLGLPVPRVAIFDQFEELFTSHAERWQDREDFFLQVTQALEGDPFLRVVFAMREDYLGQLGTYASLLPERLQTRFRLARLGKAAAVEAVTQPLRTTGRRFAAGVAEKLVDELLQTRVESSAGHTVVIMGEHIEPVQLQVVCRNLWDGLPLDTTVITEDHLQTFGDVDQALIGFYERSIQQTVQDTGVLEGDLRSWFEQSLITPAGTRGTVYRGAQQTGGIANRAVDALENLHLIRGEWRAGARWYELTHDRFIQPIQGSNEHWLSQRREAEQARQWLEGKAAEWVTLGRGRGGLLDEVELLNAERWLGVLGSAELTTSDDVSALVMTSRAAIDAAVQAEEAARQRELDQARALAEEQSRRAEAERQRAETQTAAARRLRVLVAALGVVLLLAILAAVFAIFQQGVARSNQQLAEQRAGEAVAAQSTAEAEVVMRSTAEAMAQRNEQTAATRAAEAVAAQATAQAERDRFEQQRRISAAGDLAASAIDSLSADPERSLLLALAASSVTSSANGTVRIEAQNALHQALEAARLRTAIAAHRYPLNAAAVSSDGRRLVTAGNDRMVRLWDLASNTALTTLALPDRPTAVAISPDDSKIAVGRGEGSVTVWDATTGTEMAALGGHQATVWTSAFSPDGNYLATAGEDGSIKVWSTPPGAGANETAPGEAVLTLSGHGGPVYSLAFHPECVQAGAANGCDRLLATAGADGLVKLWRLSEKAISQSSEPELTAREVLSLPAHDVATAVAFSSDGRLLATGGQDMATRVWELVESQDVDEPAWKASELLSMQSDAGAVMDLEFSLDGTRLAGAGSDGTARVWLVSDRGFTPPGAKPGDSIIAVGGHSGPASNVGFVQQCAESTATAAPSDESCEQRLVTAGQDGAIYLWDLVTGELVSTPSGHGAAAYAVAFAPNGHVLATAGQDNTAKLWSVPSELFQPGDAVPGTLVATLSGHTGWVRDLAFNHDGTRVATGSDDKTARIWDTSTGKTVLTLEGHAGTVYGVAFDPEGKRLASASWDNTARIWDAETGKTLHTLTGHTDRVNGVTFSPDGTKLATASDDKTVKLWDVASGKQLLTFRGHTNEVNDVVFNGSGAVVASGGSDREVKLWEAATGKELDTLSGHADTIFGLALSGRNLATASGDRSVRVWRLSPGYGVAGQPAYVDEWLRLTGNQASVYGVSFSPDGQRLATATADGLVKVYSLGPGEEVATLTDHRKEILGVGVSQDAKRLATSTTDGLVTIWDVASGQEVLTLPNPGEEWIWDVAFSSECGVVVGEASQRCNTRVATAGEDGTVAIWDSATGQRLLVVRGHVGAVRGVAFSPDGTRLLTLGQDATAKLWDAQTGIEVFAMADHPGPVVGGGFSGDGTKMATVSFDNDSNRWLVRVWEVATGAELPSPACQATQDEHFTLSNDFTRLAIGRADGRIALCDVGTGETLWEVDSGLETSAILDFNQDDTDLVAASQGDVRVFDVASGQELQAFPTHAAAPWFVGFVGPDDGQPQTVVLVGIDGQVALWQLPSGVAGDAQQAVAQIEFSAGPADITSVAVSPDGGILAAASDNRTVKLWDAKSYQELATLDSHADTISSVAFSPACAGQPSVVGCETRLATASYDGSAKVWSLERPPDSDGGRIIATELLTLAGHTDWIRDVTFSPDGSTLATVSDDQTAKVWDAATGEELTTLQGHDDFVSGVAFSPDGTRLATASWDGTTRIWDVLTGEQLLALDGRGRAMEDVIFSPDGIQVATASSDGVTKVWNAETGQEIFTLLGHLDRVLGVAFSPDGRRLASAGADGAVVLWDALAGEQEMTLPGSGETVRDLAFSPDGSHLVSGGADGAARVYSLDAQELQELARKRITRPLTPQECQKYLHEDICPTFWTPWIGALVQSVSPGSAADQAGLQAGDLILALDGQQVGPAQPLERFQGRYKPGEPVTITYRRGGETQETSAILGRDPGDPTSGLLGVTYTTMFAP